MSRPSVPATTWAWKRSTTVFGMSTSDPSSWAVSWGATAALKMPMVDCFAANKCYPCPTTLLLPISPAAQLDCLTNHCSGWAGLRLACTSFAQWQMGGSPPAAERWTLGGLKEWWWAPWRERSPDPRRNAVSRHADDALLSIRPTFVRLGSSEVPGDAIVQHPRATVRRPRRR